MALPANNFTDPQGSPLTYAAFETGGTNATSWLHFNPTAHEFFGTPPTGATGTFNVELVATNAYNQSAAESFSITLAPAGSRVTATPFTGASNEMLAIHS